MPADAIVVSAGKGHRFMGGMKKQFFSLGGKPILAHTLDKFEASPSVRFIFLVVSPEDVETCRQEILEKYAYRKVTRLVPGGPRRQASVKNGIEALPDDTDVVVVHDGVRPFITRAMIEESIQATKQHKAVVFGVPVKDTIKMAQPDGTVLRTLDRESLWQIQTPQTFQVHLLREAFQRAAEDQFFGTDDASLVERLGVTVHLLPGSYRNIKITTPEDLTLANLFLRGENPLEKDPSNRRQKG